MTLRRFLVLLSITSTSYVILNYSYYNFGTLKEMEKISFETKCPKDNIVTVRDGGRLGNCVWEYIAVLGLHDALGLSPFVPRSIHKCLGKVFKNFSIPAYEDTLLSEKCRIMRGGISEECESRSLPKSSRWARICYELKYGKPIADEISSKPIAELRKLKESGRLPSILILRKWIAQQHAFAHIGISGFKEEMHLRDDVRELAQITLKGVRQKVGSGKPIFVGIHVRRTDYFGYLKRNFGEKVTFADIDYYKRAIKRMREVLDDSLLVFVVVSDDYNWCKKYLVNEKEGVFWGGLEHSDFIDNWKGKKEMGMGHDLAVLALQNHSIIGYGTFALTGSLLTGGHIIGCNISRNGQVKENLTVRLCKILDNCELL